MAFSLGWRAEKVGFGSQQSRERGVVLKAGWIYSTGRGGASRQSASWVVSRGSLHLGRRKLPTVLKGFPQSGSPSRKYCHRPAQSHFSHLIPDPIKLMIDSGRAQRSLSFNSCANNRLKSILRSRRLLQSRIS